MDDDRAVPQRRSLRPQSTGQIPTGRPTGSTGEPALPADRGHVEQPPTDGVEIARAQHVSAEHAGGAATDAAHGGGRPWWKTPAAIIGAAVVVLGTAGAGVALTVGGGDETVAASPSPTPSASPSASPSPSPAPPVSLLDDGINPAELPQLGEPDGVFPAAYPIEDWVWERVGPLWTLVSLSDWEIDYEDRVGETRVYLASPEGLLFALPSPDEPQLTIHTWHEAEAQARFTVPGIYGPTTGYLLDLKDGGIEDMSFRMSDGRSLGEFFVAAAPDGTELWTSVDSVWSEYRTHWWSADGGWERVRGDGEFETWTRGLVPDERAVMFPLYTKDDSGYAGPHAGEPGQPTFALLDLDSRTVSYVNPRYPRGAVCETGWEEMYVDAVRLYCYDYPGVREGQAIEVSLDGSLRVVDEGNDMFAAASLTLDIAPVTLISERDNPAVYAVAVDIDGESVPVLEAGVGLPRSGVTLAPGGVTLPQPGVVRLTGVDACALVDYENGRSSVLLAAVGESVTVSCVGYGE